MAKKDKLVVTDVQTCRGWVTEICEYTDDVLSKDNDVIGKTIERILDFCMEDEYLVREIVLKQGEFIKIIRTRIE